MNMVLAHSAREMRRSHSTAGRDGTAATCSAAEFRYYTAALQELRSCIGVAGVWAPGKSLDVILTTIFFMIHFGLQSLSSLDQVRMHVAGFASLVATYLQGASGDSGGSKGIALSPLSSLVLLWIMYVSDPWLLPEKTI